MSDTEPEAGQTPPDASRTQGEAGQLALIAEATKRAGLIWITVPGQGSGRGRGGRPGAAAGSVARVA